MTRPTPHKCVAVPTLLRGLSRSRSHRPTHQQPHPCAQTEHGAHSTFCYSAAHGPGVATSDIFGELVQPLIARVLQGESASLIVFGSPQSGKANFLEGLRRKNGCA